MGRTAHGEGTLRALVSALARDDVVVFEPTGPEDWPFAEALEAADDVRPFIAPTTRSAVEAEVEAGRAAHLTVRRERVRVGFVLLAYAPLGGHALELRRIVAAERGRGAGRRIMTALLRGADALGAGVWLDVVDDNARARRLYESLGFEEISSAPFRGGPRRLIVMVRRPPG